MIILGISAFYHDSAAAIIVDGKIIAAAQEERFTRKKHDPSYPFHAIEFVLSFSKLKLYQIDYIVFYEKPFLKEFWEFLKARKKYWLLPIIIVLVLFGGLIILSQGSVIAPFIYPIL